MGIVEFFFKPKYRIILLRKMHGTVFLMKSIKSSFIKEMMKIDRKEYIIAIDNPAYIANNIRVYLLDYDSGSQIIMHENAQLLKPEELDLIVGNKLIKELTAGVMDNLKDKIFYAIIGLLIGALSAVVIMSFIMQSKIEEIYAKLPIFPQIGGF